MPVTPCPSPPPAPVHGVVQFLASEFLASFPEFTGINTATPAALTNNFTTATLLLNNSCGSRVSDANQRLNLLYLLVAHLTFLFQGTNDGAGNVTPAPGVVGRIDSAAEGSVSVSAAYSSQVGERQAWYIQTKYGALFWDLTARFRRFVYVRSHRDPTGFGGDFGGLGPGFGGTFDGL